MKYISAYSAVILSLPGSVTSNSNPAVPFLATSSAVQPYLSEAQ